MIARVRGAVATTFRSLSVRNFRLFFVGQLISQVGNWLTSIALTLLILHLTNSGLAIGLLVACQFGPVLLLAAWAGVIADRSDKRKLLITTQTLEMCQSAALAFFAFWHHPPLLPLYATALTGGFMLAFDNPVRRSFVSEMVPAENVSNAVTLNSALMNTSRIVGPALAGLLAVTVGFGWCFTSDAVSYLAVLAALFMMRPAELVRAPAAVRARGQVREGLRYVRDTPALRVPMLILLVVGTLTYNFSVVIPLFVERTLHGSDAQYTIVYSGLAFGSLIGALLAAHRATIEMRYVIVGCAGLGVTMLVFAASPNVPVAIPFAAAVGVSSLTFMTSITAIIQLEAAPEMRGRVLALQSILLIGTTPIGGPVLGAICDAIGSRAGVLIGGVAALAAVTWGELTWRRVAPAPAKFAISETLDTLPPVEGGS